MFGPKPWEARRDAKLAERDALLAFGRRQIFRHRPTLTSLKFAILSSTSPQLVEGIRDRRWTATQVMIVYIERTLQVQKEFNPVTEIMFERALAKAAELDKGFEKTGEVIGPLHGVPLSIKDQFSLPPFDSTIGFTHWINTPPAGCDNKPATLVALLEAAGAIAFVKSNVPQSMLAFECSNPLWGKSLNPYDKERIPGGSSGGEGVLLATDASPLGLGSDIGGSLRIPAHLSGCYSLKPTSNRFPNFGAIGANPGFEAVKGSLGPMGRSVEDLQVLSKVIVDGVVQNGLAKVEGVVELPWREVKEKEKKLKFGYYLTDGFCRASPACRRAVLETVEAVRREGHECVEIEVPALEAMQCFTALTSADGYGTLLSGLLGDPQEASLWLVTFGPKLPWLIRIFLVWLLLRVVGDASMASLLTVSCHKSVREMQRWQKIREDFVRRFREKVWGELALDGILCAPQAVPALKHGQTWNLSPLSIATILYNVVESSAGVVPVTFVDPAKDTPEEDFLRKGEPGSKLVEARVFGPGGAYNAEEMAGLPVGVQVVGAAYEEEKVLRMMDVVDRALGPRGFGPGEYTKKHPQT